MKQKLQPEPQLNGHTFFTFVYCLVILLVHNFLLLQEFLNRPSPWPAYGPHGYYGFGFNLAITGVGILVFIWLAARKVIAMSRTREL